MVGRITLSILVTVVLAIGTAFGGASGGARSKEITVQPGESVEWRVTYDASQDEKDEACILATTATTGAALILHVYDNNGKRVTAVIGGGFLILYWNVPKKQTYRIYIQNENEETVTVSVSTN